MSDLPTPRDYATVHRVDAGCVACDHWAHLDLPALILAGYGDVPLIRLPLRGVWRDGSPCGGVGTVLRAWATADHMIAPRRGALSLPASSSSRKTAARRACGCGRGEVNLSIAAGQMPETHLTCPESAARESWPLGPKLQALWQLPPHREFRLPRASS
jgi:hypothetical protein